MAPPVDPTVATNLADATAFLYTGTEPIQAGVAPGTIDRRRAAVLRGRVTTRDGADLSGVTIAIARHPEFGSTRSRADGYFDLVVNGGGFLTVAYEKEGYLPAQRQVQAPWLDFAQVPDVALVPLDPNVTTIDLTRSDPQVAHGSWMIDDNGARRMTLLFRPGTQATMKLADCTTEPLDVLSVRATEYTVGPNGPSAMPAALPATSGYTYAVEFSADEALAAGATSVGFSQAVIGYVDNFRRFPAGTTVPFALYDSAKDAWVPSTSGRVIGILESVGDLADIDSDGDGVPDDVETLSELGMDESERRFLRESYAAKSTLWRVAIPHFTPGDPNWPIVPGPGATSPNQQPPPNPTPPDNPGCDDGCIIEVESQIVGETIPVVGTPFSLEYRSDRVPGRTMQLRIPVTGGTLPPELLGIDLRIHVAGNFVRKELPATPNQTYDFTWDGLDAYGRQLQGDVPLMVRVGYVYQGYFAPGRRFGLVGEDTLAPSPFPATLFQEHSFDGNYLPRITRWDARGLGLGAWSLNVHHSYDPQGKVLRLGDGTRRTVESLQPEIRRQVGTGARGFSGDGGRAEDAEIDLTTPELCDPYFGCEGGADGGAPPGIAVAADGGFYFADLGNCRVRHVRPDGIIQTVAGTGVCDLGAGELEPEPEACGPGTDPLALSVDLTPIDLTVAPDGNVYIVSSPIRSGSGSGYGDGGIIPEYDALASKIYRLDVATGTLRRVAGNGYDGSFEEDIPATQAFVRARDLAVAPDGTLYIADTGAQRIRRVGPDGLITTIAGEGVRGFSGDGGPATRASFADPAGVAIDADGILYIADQANGRIRRVRPDGIVDTIAGGGSDPEDGAAPLEAKVLSPFDVALGPDASLYFVELNPLLGGEGPASGRVRKITPEGTVETVAGAFGDAIAEAPESFVDRRPATSLTMLPTDVDVAPDGGVYMNELIHNRVLRVAPPLPGVGVTDVLIPTEQAREVFVFNDAGRHLRTVNPETGSALLTFGYDPTTRRLVTVTDADGNVTAIHHDTRGNPESITSPHGQVTELEVDSNGFLSLVKNPAGESRAMSYTPGGLLSTFTDPRGGVHQFEWNESGRLIRETNPAEVSKTFEREDTNSYEVTKTSALGRESSTFVDGPPQGPNTTVTTHPDGTRTTVVMQKDGTTITTMPDGTRRTMKRLPDERFGTLAPVMETVVQTPEGLTAVTASSREVLLSNPEDALSVQSVIERTAVNGDVFESIYSADLRRYTRTSPEGRQSSETVDGQGRVVRRDVPGLASTLFSYDERGRLESVIRGTPEQTAAEGGPRTTTFSYNEQGQLDTVSAPLGQVTRFRDHDGAGRARTQILPGNRTVAYTYDGNSNVTSVTPPDRPPHAFDYTPLDLLASYAPPEPSVDAGGAWSTGYTYDAEKSLDLVTRPDGLQIDYRYDSAGRLQSLVFPSPTDPAVNESNTLGYDAAGRLETLTSPSGVTLTYGYDGPLVVSETWSGAVSGSLVRGYDEHFRVVSEAVGATAPISFGYDRDGLLSQAGELTLTRDPTNGLLVGTSIGELSETFAYNAFGELTQLTASASADDASSLFAVTYERDALGRITQKAETIAGVTTTFGYSYDPAGRLELVTKNGVETARYRYDANGNRLSKTVPGQAPIEATYDSQDRLITYGDATYTYTRNGELHTKTDSEGTTTYSYDVLGNLRRVVLPDETVIDYLVDGKNRRVGKKINGTLVQAFVYGDSLSPIAELDGHSSVISRFVFSKRGKGAPEYMVRNGVVYRIVMDNLRSPRLVVSTMTGDVVQRMDFDEWGLVTSDTNQGFQPFGFSGGLPDVDSGILRFGARDYEPEAGRWMAKDPTRFDFAEFNMYEYALADPASTVDRDGRVAVGPSANANIGIAASNSKSILPISVWPEERGQACFDPDNHEHCVRLYELCDKEGWTGECDMCLHFCEVQGEWPFNQCRAR